MARGRPPKPVELKLLQGNAGKRKLPNQGDAPEALVTVPQPPDYFGGEAREVWARAAPWLVEVKVLTDTDLHNLEAFCMAYQRWREAQEDVTRNGIIVRAGKKKVKNPACTVINETSRQMVTFGAALGLDPSSRARVTGGAGGKPNEDDPFEGLLRGRA
ncbi:phage terminase small subunit P27 family [Pseudomonas fulva]|uniref:phage terminase small subunit P27 family n=1 Tax=Pseudomonas fulva TaxID=47880 RepID=UPI0018AC4DD9|nr:phage terminase small subunit P27 family [Pseudomonas fulva]MBF8694913.1 phage terminase small subunit P27 family [Pseudomonas fulva]